MTPAPGKPRSASSATRRPARLAQRQTPERQLNAVASHPDDGTPPQEGRLGSAPQDDDSAHGPVPSRPLRVVIVEDEAIISMELEMLLEDLEAEVLGIAMTAAEAEALVAEHRPDCVTMDINIKGPRDGVSAAQAIYEVHGVRAIFVSAYGDAATMARAEAARPFGWITKPIDKDDLALALARVKQEQS